MTAPRQSLAALLRAAGVRAEVTGPSGVEVTRIVYDSRRVEPGALFCALAGQRLDGMAFVDQAVARGAHAVLAERARPAGLADSVAWVQVEHARRAMAQLARAWHGEPDRALVLVGVTGTNGKTTVTHLVQCMGDAAGFAAGRIGTLGAAHGAAATALERTTPEAPDLLAQLGRMREDGARLVVMEVSSHALALERVAGIRFRVGAFLNLGADHLDFHGDLDGYFAAKARLIASLEADAHAILAQDDPRIAALGERTRARVWRFGRTAAAQVRILEEDCRLDGTRAVLETPAGRLALESPLVGPFVPDNLAAAAACALAAGLPPAAISEGARLLRGVPGRMEPVDAGQPFRVFVDFAHTPQALQGLLAGLRPLVGGRILLVFGCGGERDREKRPEMGRIAARAADLVFVTSDNPRGEDPERILDAIMAGVAQVPGASARVQRDADRRRAVARALSCAREGDVVLIAGKGHETTQVFADRAVPLDDRQLARDALAALGFGSGCRAT